MSNKIQAMFYVHEIHLTNSDYIRVFLNPVTRNVAKDPHSSANPGGSYESPNIDWSKYTPSGRIEMTVSKDTGAAQMFLDALEAKIDIPLEFTVNL